MMYDKVLLCDFLMAIEASAKKEMSNWRRERMLKAKKSLRNHRPPPLAAIT